MARGLHLTLQLPRRTSTGGVGENSWGVEPLTLRQFKHCLVCSLPTHTRSSANAEGPRAHFHSKSCKNAAQMFDGLHLKRPVTCE